MPAHRKLPPRASQQRNAKVEAEPAVRTRHGRGVKASPTKAEAKIPPKTSPRHANGRVTRKYSSDGDYGSPVPQQLPGSDAESFDHNQSDALSSMDEDDDSPIDQYRSPSPPELKRVRCEITSKGRLCIFCPQDFLANLLEKEKRSQRKERLYTGQFTQSDLDTTTEEDVPTPPTTGFGRGRGRGGRGGRGRGRGGRGRGRGATTATSTALTRALSPQRLSPLRTRKPRKSATQQVALDEEDAGEHSANQEAENDNAKTMDTEMVDEDEGDPMDITPDDEEQEDDDDANDTIEQGQVSPQTTRNRRAGAQPSPTKSRGGRAQVEAPVSAPPESSPELTEKVPQGTLLKRAAQLIQESASQTPVNGTSTREASPVPPMLDPEDDILSDSDLPEPWIYDYVPPVTEEECEDRADFLLKTQFKPMTDVQDIIASLTKYAPSQRSTENLYRLAENTQRILKAWQDEYLQLDAKTAPHAHPPKKPAHGGRVPINPLVFEDMKEADLYGYVFDARKAPGCQDPFAQRIGAEKMGRRELRQRRKRDLLDSAAASEEEGEGEGRAAGRRQRRATRRFDAIATEQPSGSNTPKKNNGWGGARKRGVSRFAQEASENQTPEADGRPAKRAKVAGPAVVHPRIQEMREESAVASSSEEPTPPEKDTANEVQEPPRIVEEGRKRGRPAGSKNTGRRSDYGIKKGPRKKPADAASAAPTTQAPPPSAPPPPPPVLQSLSEGQNQFSIDPQAQVSAPQQPILAPAAPAPSPMPQPVMSQPVMSQPVMSQPVMSQPVMSQPIMPQPVSSQPIMPQPIMPHPVSTVFQVAPQPLGMPEPVVRQPQPTEPPPEAYMSTTPLSQYTNPYAESTTTSPTSGSKRKPRVKSEKRSQSMTIWWAERKAKQKEAEASNAPTAAGSPTDGGKGGSSKSSTPKPTSRRGGKANSSRSEQSPHLRPSGEAYPTPPPPPSTHAHPQHIEYVPAMHHHHHHSQPPPGQMIMQHSPLAAMPSVPPQLAQHGPPHPVSTRPSMLVLAPAPMPPQLQSYPSPYGPRSAPRPKGSGPPPLAPAPPTHTHISPYPPTHGPIMQRENMEMPFKVLVPGPPPPGEERRG